MADELELDLETEDQVPKSEKRIKDLSEKVKLTAQERDDFAKAKADEEVARTAAEKERDFYKNFNNIASKYQGATEYQDKILEKVNAGYDAEDATISILAKEGKYTPQAVAPQPQDSPAGGSAANAISATGDKSLTDMSKDEKKSGLEEALNKGEIRFGGL